MTKKLYMQVAEPLPNASIIDAGSLPLLTGVEDTNIACGACKAVIFKGVSVETLAAKFAAPTQLLVQCTCGQHVRVPATLGN